MAFQLPDPATPFGERVARRLQEVPASCRHRQRRQKCNSAGRIAYCDCFAGKIRYCQLPENLFSLSRFYLQHPPGSPHCSSLSSLSTNII